MEELERLADLLRARNVIENDIAYLIQRPAIQGHIGEFIGSKVFGIQLESSATHKASDGRFVHGPLTGKSVDIKLYGKQEGILAVMEDEQPDYFLVLTGPETAPAGSKGSTRPLVIDHVYLFSGQDIADGLRRRGAKFGVAASVPKELWRLAEVFPKATNQLLQLTEEQRTILAKFSSRAGV